MIPAGIQLGFTAPGDNLDQGTADSYDVRYNTSPINSNTDFMNAQQVGGVSAPKPAGSTETLSIPGLAPGTYYFRIKTSDGSGNVSSMSNQDSATIP